MSKEIHHKSTAPPPHLKHPASLAASDLAYDAPKPIRTGETEKAIAAIVQSLPQGTHLTAPEVFEKAKALKLDVSLATVYRTLNRLKSRGHVMTVAGERGLRYEAVTQGPEHDHLICLGCGLTIEFVDELIHGFGKTVAERKGFEHKSSRFDILGYCSNCSSKDEANRLKQVDLSYLDALGKCMSLTSLLQQALAYNQTRKPLKALQSSKEAIAQLETLMLDCQNILTLLVGSSDVGTRTTQ